MGLVALASAVLLAVVFAVSSAAKALDRRGTHEAVVAMGVPRHLSPGVAVLLPPAELALAVLVLPAPTGRPTAAIAFGLLTAFTVLVLGNLLRGRRPACACFGGLGSSELSWRTVVRNLVLLAAAGFATTVRDPFSLTPVVAGLAAAGLLLAAEHRVARQGAARPGSTVRDAVAPGRPSPGAPVPAPAFSLPTVTGERLGLDDLRAAGRPVLVVFLSLSCHSCLDLLPAVLRWHGALAERLTVVALVDGTPESVAAALPEGTAAPVLLSHLDVTGAYALRGVPSAALVTSDGMLDGDVVAGDVAVHALLARALGRDGSAGPEELDLQSRPTASSFVTREDGDGSTVLVDEVTGGSLSLDPVGTLVWDCLDGTSTVQAIADDLAEAFGADPVAVQHDVLRVVRACAQAGLVHARPVRQVVA